MDELRAQGFEGNYLSSNLSPFTNCFCDFEESAKTPCVSALSYKNEDNNRTYAIKIW